MIQKLKTIAVSLAALALLVGPALVLGTSAFAATDRGGDEDVNIGSSLCDGTKFNVDTTPDGDCSDGDGGTSLNNLLTDAVNIFSAIVGVIAVIMIIVGGLKYITSGGDSSKVGAAKNTLIYAIIGLVIVALAQVIVHFVLQKAGEI